MGGGVSQIMGYIMPHGQKKDVINVILGIAHHLYITLSHRGRGVSQKLMFVEMGRGREGGLETPKNCLCNI